MNKPALIRTVQSNKWLVLWVLLSGLTILFMTYGESASWIFKYPRAWQIPLADWISSLMKWLINDFSLGLFTFKEFTRGIAWVIDQPYWIMKSLLSTGFLKGVGSYAEEVFPPVSWVAVICGAMLLGHYARGWKLSLLVGGCLAYIVMFGQMG